MGWIDIDEGKGYNSDGKLVRILMDGEIYDEGMPGFECAVVEKNRRLNSFWRRFFE